MQLGETIATYDVALALRGESGKFEVTSPAGEIFRVTCKPNHSISSFEWCGSKADVQPFLVRKVAEPVSLQRGKATTEAVEDDHQPRAGQAPFLLENQPSEAESPNGDRVVSLPKIVEQNSGRDLEIASIDLLFLESDARTGKPAASVCVKRGQTDPLGENEGTITSACATLNEFDAEIRRLHAQLDEMRARARKLFYKSQVVVASA